LLKNKTEKEATSFRAPLTSYLQMDSEPRHEEVQQNELILI